MRTPKSLQLLADKFNLFIEVLIFHANGQSSKGFALVDSDSNEIVEIEPVWYSNGDRWKINVRGQSGLIYVKSLRNLKLELKAGHTGWKFTSLTSQGNVLKSGISERR